MIELERIGVSKDITNGSGESGEFYLADCVEVMPEILERYAGQVQMIYLDPPLVSGKKTDARMYVGEKDWATGTASTLIHSTNSVVSKEEYLEMMRRVLRGCKELLNDSGTIFVHADSCMQAYIKVMMDDIFGMKNMLNEIVWTYQTGGRAKNYFSRKHDTILFYRKSPKYYFDMRSVELIDPDGRSNHMKRGIDADGRSYRSIKSGGKTYTYYDDSPIYPTDVWSDVNHMRQSDLQRTGYDTQKPLELMRRIIKCSTKPGDIVCDLFAGSGSTLDAAHGLGRRFISADINPISMFVIRKRLCSAPVEYRFTPAVGEAEAKITGVIGVGHYIITLDDFVPDPKLSFRVFSELDCVDNWSVGYIKNGAFCQEAYFTRSRVAPELKRELWLPSFEGVAAVRVGDVFGNNTYYKFDKDGIR